MKNQTQEKLERRVKKILNKRRSELPEGLHLAGRGPGMGGMGMRGVYTGPRFYHNGEELHLPDANLGQISGKNSYLMQVLNRTHYEVLRQVNYWNRKDDKTSDDRYFILSKIWLTSGEQARQIRYWHGIDLHEATRGGYVPDYEKDFFRAIYGGKRMARRFFRASCYKEELVPPILNNSVWDKMSNLEIWKIRVNEIKEKYSRKKQK